jgi:hypothetical protein
MMVVDDRVRQARWYCDSVLVRVESFVEIVAFPREDTVSDAVCFEILDVGDDIASERVGFLVCDYHPIDVVIVESHDGSIALSSGETRFYNGRFV